MSFDSRDARSHLNADALANGLANTQTLRDAYRDVWLSQNGQLVLADLLRVYHDRLDAEINLSEVATLDHPYCMYYVEGQRSVVARLRALAIELRKPPDEELDNGPA